MLKKSWQTPSLKELQIEKTEYGNQVKQKPDGAVKVGNYTYYSFS